MPIDLQEATHEALVGELLRRGALKALNEAVTNIHQAAIGSIQEQLACAASPDATSIASKRLGRAVLALQLELAKVEEMGGGVQRSAFFTTTLQEWDADMPDSDIPPDQPTAESAAKAEQRKVEIAYDQEDVKDIIVSRRAPEFMHWHLLADQLLSPRRATDHRSGTPTLLRLPYRCAKVRANRCCASPSTFNRGLGCSTSQRKPENDEEREHPPRSHAVPGAARASQCRGRKQPDPVGMGSCGTQRCG